MLDTQTKNRIQTARDILVGKVPDPKSQVEQITIALIYKFMDDMDVEAEELGGKRTFFKGEFAKYAWRKIFDPRQSGHDLLILYSEAITKMDKNPGIPKLFRDIFKNAYLPYRDPETLKSFLKIINEFEYTHSEKLGDAFEFLLSVLGSQGEAGQFRTPRHIIDFMVAIVDPKKNETILDPACGTAGFLISSYKHIIKQNSSNYNPDQNGAATGNGTQSVHEVIISSNGYTGDKLTSDERRILADNIHGYDISPDMVRLSLVNMYLHGISEPHISEYDTLTSEDNWNHYSDVILANPPFMSPKGGIRPHKRFSITSNRSEVLFVDYIAEHLIPQGRAVVIVPEGIIFQSGKAYKSLRKMLVEEYLVGVISLPAGVFQPYSGVKTSILWLDKVLAKKTDKILFVKIENDGFDLGAQRRAIKENDLPDSLGILEYYKTQLGSGNANTQMDSKNLILVEKAAIGRSGEYVLNGDRYRESSIEKHTKYDLIPIGEICELLNGRAFKPSDWETIDKGGMPIIRIQNLNDPKAEYNYFSGEVSKKNLVEQGDLLFSWSGSKGTSFGAHIWDGEKAVLNQHIFKVKYSSSIVNKTYLYYALNKAVEEVEQNLHGGVGLVHITKVNLEKIKIPVPPMFIQEEIVTELETYQKIIDGARMVVENYKPRIEIDPEWEMLELSEVCIINPKKSEVKELNPSLEVSFVPMADINEYIINFTPKNVKQLQEVYGSYTYFIDSDVILARVTPCFENGKAGIASGLKNGIGFGSSEFTVLRCRDNVLPEWIYVSITSDSFRKEGKLRMTGTGGLQRVPNEYVSSFRVPVPDLNIQKSHIEQLHEELKCVESNRRIINMYEKKIKDRIAKVWGE